MNNKRVTFGIGKEIENSYSKSHSSPLVLLAQFNRIVSFHWLDRLVRLAIQFDKMEDALPQEETRHNHA